MSSILSNERKFNILTEDDYKLILIALDNENINDLVKLFNKFELEIKSELFDAPRIIDNITINTYIEYILVNNLCNVLEYMINEEHLVISDDILARCIELYSFDMYNYLLLLGYIPQIDSLKTAIHYGNSVITNQILEIDSELINDIDEEDIEILFNFAIDEETIEIISLLINNNINPLLFSKFLYLIEHPDDNYLFSIETNELSYALEILVLFKNYNVPEYSLPFEQLDINLSIDNLQI